jgi:ataxia telangiectasia mutated family protein
MRQDAIMMQIFSVVNNFLNLNDEMRKKHARIRTYRVVPFSRRSGILEWCTNTMPVGLYLIGERVRNGRKGAHELYRPRDWKPMDCAGIISDISSLNNDEKLKRFEEICDHLKPVFQNFFYERYKSPGELFERRYAYILSVAVSSMIGYILGIGDRHVQNILIDESTAEIIHIDFGVAFELGKCLPHPELIPFRLTRDIIAPMGVSGVDGIFRRNCEKTMEILRENEKTIMTILEVLLYDPTYQWSLGAEQAKRIQLESDSVDSQECEVSEHQDTMASRALQRIQAKLKGIVENNLVNYPSIEGQVQFLIQQATSNELLCRLFRGWQAYL